mmetsp:Transcript_43271/g.79169  ORF Transcript_43271/g.79169 Transcript_43271/m.79169 type:complete len:411 (+) Transcript_43271:458-1690(+)
MPHFTSSQSSSTLYSSVDNEVSWNDLSVVELKKQLKSNDLPVSGVKAVLIQRLEDHQSSSQPPSTKTSKYFSANNEQSTPLKGAVRFGVAEKTPSKSPQSPSTPSKKKTKKSPPAVTPEKRGSAINKTPTKRKSPPKMKSTLPSRKRIKIEPGSLPPPENWEKIYKLVEELRSDRSAPVDTDGGHELPEKQLGPVVHRYQILTALMLSSQTKDAVVGETMRILQRHGLTVENIHNTDSETLNAFIGKVGFHNNKTKFMKQAAEIILSQFSGDIPPTAEGMMTLPGVGPKMAYIVENIAFGTVTGIGVDTHMHRIFNDLKWVDSKTPEKTREQLEGWLPKQRWGEINVLWVGFGQEVQQQKEKSLRKALACSSPREALGLVQKLRLDVKKEAKRFGLEEELNKVLNGTMYR